MFDLKIIMNSSMEDVLSCRCAGLHNQNLELHVKNTGEQPVSIKGYFELENDTDTYRCENLFPPWQQAIGSGRTIAFYCSLDQNIWDKYNTIIIFDTMGNAYRFPTSEAVYQ